MFVRLIEETHCNGTAIHQLIIYNNIKIRMWTVPSRTEVSNIVCNNQFIQINWQKNRVRVAIEFDSSVVTCRKRGVIVSECYCLKGEGGGGV